MVVHPYIPNSDAETRARMLAAIGAESIEDLYESIPNELRVDGLLNLPAPFLAEADLVRHVEGLLNQNVSTRDAVSFLGAGCYAHHVPAVCDEVNGRSEFLTAYAGEPYEDHGRFQALFEYASMMGELLEMDVVNVPVYDGYQAAATALRITGRITGRTRVLVAASTAADERSKIVDYLKPDLDVHFIPSDRESGMVDLAAFRESLDASVAGVLLQSPNYFGVVEVHTAQIAEYVHQNGSLLVVSADPISLGVLAAPATLGADIVCGDIQSLGMHQYFGGGHAGYIAVRDEQYLVEQLPSRLFGIAPTSVSGEFGFGDVAYERTSFAVREQGKEWVGTAAALWGITAGVYLALMGPLGMTDIGETILARTRYAMKQLSRVPGLRVHHVDAPHFREFVLDCNASGRSVAEIDEKLRAEGVFIGKDLSDEFPEFGQSVLVCVTELTTKANIDLLATLLETVSLA